MRVALASLLLGLKDNQKATHRCRRRLGRSIRMLEGGTTPVSAPFNDEAVAREAVAWLRRGCELCRKCPGP